MTFDEAERKFRELQTRVQRGESISRADYEAMVAELAVQDDRGVLWEINPRTGKWMYFDGAEWVVGRPPGRDQSTVIPVSQAMTPPPGATPPPMPRSQLAPAPPGATPPPMPRSQLAPAPQARPSGATPPPMPRPGAAGPTTPISTQPPESVQEGPGALGGTQRSRMSPGLGGSGSREWIPLAIAAVVLLFCAVVIFGVAVLNPGGIFGRQATPTAARTATVRATIPPPTVTLPTLPPPTATSAPVIAKVTATTGNVRAAPKTGRVITTLKRNAEVTLIARSEDSQWFQINVAGQPAPGWIALEILQITSGDPKTLPVAGAAPNPTPTKQTSAPPPSAAALSSATPTIIGAPTQTSTPTQTPKP